MNLKTRLLGLILLVAPKWGMDVMVEAMCREPQRSMMIRLADKMRADARQS